MSFSTPKGWEKDNDKLYIHNTGVRVQLMTYRQKEGWYLVPTDLDQPVLEFEPTPEGRAKAFEAFAAGVLETKPKRTKKPESAETKKKKAAAAAAKAKEEGEEAAEDDDEKEEAGEADEGDEG